VFVFKWQEHKQNEQHNPIVGVENESVRQEMVESNVSYISNMPFNWEIFKITGVCIFLTFTALLIKQIFLPVSSHHKSDSEIQLELQANWPQQRKSCAFWVCFMIGIINRSLFFVHRRTDDEELTADITSQVFLKALINNKKYDTKVFLFLPGFFRIAFNEINMYFRKNNSQRVVSLKSKMACCR